MGCLWRILPSSSTTGGVGCLAGRKQKQKQKKCSRGNFVLKRFDRVYVALFCLVGNDATGAPAVLFCGYRGRSVVRFRNVHSFRMPVEREEACISILSLLYVLPTMVRFEICSQANRVKTMFGVWRTGAVALALSSPGMRLSFSSTASLGPFSRALANSVLSAPRFALVPTKRLRSDLI